MGAILSIVATRRQKRVEIRIERGTAGLPPLLSSFPCGGVTPSKSAGRDAGSFYSVQRFVLSDGASNCTQSLRAAF